ncbi:hypothetical protein LWI29_024975 [Acer saccharum]|uniref:Uncharacterized protein n=1 Tax=Acer saccharum TaxID=4024 RepID=A0AA39SN02_ACESA|nr:hypothetical protein LWI29_024975 [Acer saccharum]
MGIYEVEFQGTKVKAILVDHEAALDSKIAEFKTSLQNQGCPVLGIDFKVNSCDNKVELLILCGVNHCLLIKLPNIHSYPRSLEEVLSDGNLCFVGIGIRDKIPGLTLESVYWKSDAGEPLSFYMSRIVEVCDLAAKVLKKPKLCKCGLAELDKEVRINSTVASTASSTSSCPVMDSKVKVEIASLPNSKVKVEIASLPDSKVTVGIASLLDSKVNVEINSKVTVEIASLPDSKVKAEKASLPEMIECIPDWKAVVFSDEEIKFEYGINLRIHVVLIIIAIPMKYLSKIGTYEVDFQGAKVKAILVTNEAILEAKIAELRSSLQRQKCSVVGIDFKLYTGTKVKAVLVDHEATLDANIAEFKTSLQNQGCPVLGIDFKVNSCDQKVELLILCGVNHCLLIKLPNIHSYPRSLAEVLSDRNLCSVGIGIRDKILDAKIAELRSSLQRQKCSVVGIDFILYTGKKAKLMILCSLNVCLIIKLAKLHSTPYNLKNFLEDKSVCFVGNGIRDKLPSLTSVNDLWRISLFYPEKHLSISISGVVEACDLASMVMKKSNLCNSGLAEMNKEVRINTVASTTASSSSSLPPPVSKVQVEKANLPVITCPNWNAVGFSDEEIKYVIHDAYTCCFIGDRLLGLGNDRCF